MKHNLKILNLLNPKRVRLSEFNYLKKRKKEKNKVNIVKYNFDIT
jgi:hypothetical protein